MQMTKLSYCSSKIKIYLRYIIFGHIVIIFKSVRDPSSPFSKALSESASSSNSSSWSQCHCTAKLQHVLTVSQGVVPMNVVASSYTKRSPNDTQYFVCFLNCLVVLYFKG